MSQQPTHSNYAELRVVETGTRGDVSGEHLRFEASIEVDGFSARRAFVARTDVIADFLAQLQGLIEGRTPAARFECGVVAGSVDVVYFSCQVDQLAAVGDIAVQLSLGTAGSTGLLHRLHVAMRLGTESVTAFQHELGRIVTRREGTAVIRQSGVAQPDPETEPATP